MATSKYEITRLTTVDFTLISISRKDKKQIRLTWSKLYELIEPLFQGETFFEVFPKKDKIVNGDDCSRHFWSGKQVEKFNLTNLPYYTTFTISQYVDTENYWKSETYSNNILL